MANLPIMTNLGLWTATGQAWLVSDGPFPFDNCNDLTTSALERRIVIDCWRHRVAVFQATEKIAQQHGLTLKEWLGRDDPMGWYSRKDEAQ